MFKLRWWAQCSPQVLSKAKNQNLFHQKQQNSHADLLISRQKHELDEIISLKEQVSEIAHLKSKFLAMKTELAEIKEQSKHHEKKLSELITYSIFHTKNTKRSASLSEGRQKRYSVVHLCKLLMRISLSLPPLRLIHLQRHQPW